MFDLSFMHLHVLSITGLLIIFGFYTGALARKVKLPSIIGFMLIGVLFGESVFNFLSHAKLESVSFVTEIALGMVAFTIGAELDVKSLKRLGFGIVAIIFSESLLAFIIVSVTLYFYTGNLPMALIFGALAPASAPAGTVAVIKEYRASGSLTKALYAVVGFDDGLAIFIFGFAAALSESILTSMATGQESNLLYAMKQPAIEIGLSLILGTIIGFVFCQLIRFISNKRDLFIISMGTIFFGVGISNQFHLSLILTNMVVGFFMVNTRRASLTNKVMEPLEEIMPFVFVLFFGLAGAHLKISALPALGIIGILYIIARTIGLMGGAWFGAIIGKSEPKIRKYLGLGILSQAGVAIGLSLIIQHDLALLAAKYPAEFAALEKTHPSFNPLTIGAAAITTITTTSIFFEIIGPILTKIALVKADEIPKH